MKAREILAIPIAGLLACSLLTPSTARCDPPADFKEDDLVGTWVSQVNTDLGVDTLTIREDHLYRQRIVLLDPTLTYEGDWLPWSIERSPSGTLYLHMTGMRLYAFNPNLMVGNVVGGGDGWFIDFCQEPVAMPDGTEIYPGVQMPEGEAILVVMRDRSIIAPAARRISLSLLPISDTSSWFYELENPYIELYPP